MLFLYDVCNVKQQLYAKGLVWSQGGKHFSKTFSIFYMLNSKKRVFYPYFSIGTCSTRKRFLRIIQGLNLLSFSLKKYHFLWNFSLVIFMGSPSLRLSEVLSSWSFSTIVTNFIIGHHFLTTKSRLDVSKRNTRDDPKVLILAWYLCNQQCNMPENCIK